MYIPTHGHSSGKSESRYYVLYSLSKVYVQGGAPASAHVGLV